MDRRTANDRRTRSVQRGFQMIVLIPAYEPDEKLTELVRELRASSDCEIVIVDDGSSERCRSVFQELENVCTILHHPENKGKGAAIKTGLRHISQHASGNDGIITADADGQHLVKDILRVEDEWEKTPDDLILGSRRFTGKVPFRSLAGNAFTRFIFHACTGIRVYDTQTGLRAFSCTRIPSFLALEGDRYEFEINMLLYAGRLGIHVRELTIETVYIEENRASHFHPLRDGWRIYKMILFFAASSILSFLIDYFAFILLSLITRGRIRRWLLVSECGARVLSAYCNYRINKEVVFRNSSKGSMLRYAFTALFILALNYLIMVVLTKIIPYPLAKIIVEMILYPFSYYLQRKYVFPIAEK